LSDMVAVSMAGQHVLQDAAAGGRPTMTMPAALG
jgi:hypothetical protein